MIYSKPNEYLLDYQHNTILVQSVEKIVEYLGVLLQVLGGILVLFFILLNEVPIEKLDEED